ncbi:MAG: DUF6513 domain-containing protein [Planctomycetaceae bacterium]
MSSRERILFVTGRLAESSVRRTVPTVAAAVGFDYDIQVLGISVAALMHVGWLKRRLEITQSYDKVLLPGLVQGDLEELSDHFHLPFELGPKDIFDLSEHFGKKSRQAVDLSNYDVEILAEINHAPKLSDRQLVEFANRYREQGANVIDLGAIPGVSWDRVGEVVRLLVSEGHRVSIDSFDRREVEAAVAAGAELVLSCNSSNRDWACQLGAELVVIPDDPSDLSTLDESVSFLNAKGTKYRLDPILEPVGYGFAASLLRYATIRERYADAAMMMGIGNVTEMGEVDSSGMQLLLAAICQEWSIRSVLTTAVAPWCVTAVKEFDLARRLAHYAVEQRSLPKHVTSALLLLRDSKVRELGQEGLAALAAQLTDPNYRIFVDGGTLHLMNRDGYWRGDDPFEILDRVLIESTPLDPSHAFYLGYELCKARTALTLGKQYRQDQALRWGFLTVEEPSRHTRLSERSQSSRGGE